jgi:anti-sigma factor RsiW
MPREHISTEDLAAYLEGRTGVEERARIETHLIRCDACLDDALATLACLPPSSQPPSENGKLSS